MKLYFLSILVFSQLILNAQVTFTKQFSTRWYDVGFSVLQTYDDGYIINSGIIIDEKTYIWLIKTNENGDTLWTRTYSNGLTKGSSDHSLVQCKDSGFAVIGHRNGNVYLLHISKDGDSLWGKDLGRGYALALEKEVNNDFFITGRDTNFLFLKATQNGELLLHKNIKILPPGTIGYTEGRSIKATRDSGHIVGGRYIWGDRWMAFCKINSEGEVIWSKDLTFSFSTCYSIICSNDSGYILGGEASGDALIIKSDEFGDTLWVNRIGAHSDRESIKSVIQCEEGGFIACGSREVNYGNETVLLIKLNSEGSLVWSKDLHKGFNLYGNSIYQTSDNGFIICGQIRESDSSSFDVILIKTDTAGEISWIKHVYNSPKITVYPNPASEYITIEIPEQSINATIEIFDLSGKCQIQAKSVPGKKGTTVYIGSLEPGEYLVKISGGRNLYSTKKIIRM